MKNTLSAVIPLPHFVSHCFSAFARFYHFVKFQDRNTWRRIQVPLVEMRLSDITDLVKKLDISSERISVIVEKINASNLTGLVLSACDLREVQETLKVYFA